MGQEDDGVERQLVGKGAGDVQMAVVDGVEAAAEQADGGAAGRGSHARAFLNRVSGSLKGQTAAFRLPETARVYSFLNSHTLPSRRKLR